MDVRKYRLNLSTPSKVRKALSKVANLVINDELDAKQANSIILACNAILGAIRTDEQQTKIAQLERILTEMGRM